MDNGPMPRTVVKPWARELEGGPPSGETGRGVGERRGSNGGKKNVVELFTTRAQSRVGFLRTFSVHMFRVKGADFHSEELGWGPTYPVPPGQEINHTHLT